MINYLSVKKKIFTLMLLVISPEKKRENGQIAKSADPR